MKPLISQKKGMTLPALLAIVIVVFSLAFSVLSYMVFQANLVEKNIRYSQEYTNSTTSIKAIQHIISRDEITDISAITNIASYFDVQVETVSPGVFRFYKPLEAVSRTVSSYIANETSSVQTYDEVFSFTGIEDDFELNPLINGTSMLAAFSETYLIEQFPSITIDDDFLSFDDIVDFYRSLTNDYYTIEDPDYIEDQSNPYINDYIFIDGDLELEDQNLIIEEGYVLVVDGDFYVEGDVYIEGNMIINGDMEVDSSRRDYKEIIGTFYVAEDIEIGRTSVLGTSERPSFFITNEDVELDNRVTVYGFFICDDFEGDRGRTFIEGGVYAQDDIDVKERNLSPNTTMSSDELYDFAVSQTIIVESEGGDLTYTMTEPKLE